jgi:biopolymer transport protein ExbB/TolQ
MAREDTRWFIVGVIVLSMVLFFALPMSVLVYVDMQKRLSMAEVRIERKLKRMEQLENKLKEANEKPANRAEPSGDSRL